MKKTVKLGLCIIIIVLSFSLNRAFAQQPFQAIPLSGNFSWGLQTSPTVGAVGIGQFSSSTQLPSAFIIDGNLMPISTGNLFRTNGPSTSDNIWEMWTGTTSPNEVFRLFAVQNSLDFYLQASNGDMIFNVNYANGTPLEAIHITGINYSGGPGNIGINTGNAVPGTINELLTVDKGNVNIMADLYSVSNFGYKLDGNYILWHNGRQSRLYCGIFAGNNNADGWFNTCIGYCAGFSLDHGDSNTFVGAKSGSVIAKGSSNTAVGFESLIEGTTFFPIYTGSRNTAMGHSALRNNTGDNNTANGYKALYNNTMGWGNTAIGYQAMYNNTTGGWQFGTSSSSPNTAIGFLSLTNNTTGSSNTAVGCGALSTNIDGNDNVAIGTIALGAKRYGNCNTAVGNLSLLQNGSVSNTENYNTALGYFATVASSSTPYSNSTAIGYGATATTSDFVQLGNATTSGFGGNGFILWSDGRFKFNITDNVHGLDFITKLKPVTYQLNTEKLDDFQNKDLPDSLKALRKEGMHYTEATARIHSGFIAQQVDSAAVASGFSSSIVYVPNDTSEQTYGLAYAEMVVPLVKAVQELDVKSGKDYDFLLAGSGNNPANAADIDSIKSTNGYLEINKSSITPAAVLDVVNKSSIANFKNTGAAAFNTDATGFSFPEDTINWGTPTLINVVSNVTNVPDVDADIIGISSHITSSASNGNNIASYNSIDGSCNTNTGVLVYASGANTNYGVNSNVYTGSSSPSGYGLHGYVMAQDVDCNIFNCGVYGDAEFGGINIGGKFESNGYGGCTSIPQTNYGVNSIAVGGDLNYGIYATGFGFGNSTSYAGYFNGNVAYTGTLTHISDAKFKSNISNFHNGLSIISQLRPCTYTYNSTQYPNMNFSQGIQYGLVAQEANQVIPFAVSNSVFPARYNNQNVKISDTIQYKSINYISLIPITIEAIQELKSKGDSVNHSLTTKIDSLQQIINSYENRFNALEQMINACCHTNPGGNRTHQNSTDTTKVTDVYLANFQEVVLNQNQPNPFSENTLVTYFIPENIKFAQIIFMDNYGKILKTVDITTSGDGAIKVYAANLSSGLYTYSLVIDGKVVESKKMVCTKK